MWGNWRGNPEWAKKGIWWIETNSKGLVPGKVVSVSSCASYGGRARVLTRKTSSTNSPFATTNPPSVNIPPERPESQMRYLGAKQTTNGKKREVGGDRYLASERHRFWRDFCYLLSRTVPLRAERENRERISPPNQWAWYYVGEFGKLWRSMLRGGTHRLAK